MRGNLLAIILILVGAVALGANLDLFHIDLIGILKKWWPAAFILLGVMLFFTPEQK